MALLPYALVTLAEAKTALGITGSSQDAKLEALINAATEQIEGFCQNAFVQREFEEFHTGGVNGRRGRARLIELRRYPIVSVGSITDDSGETVEEEDFLVWPERGFLEHVYRWPVPMRERGGTGRWRIVYTAGRFATTADVSADLKEAVFGLLRFWRAHTPGVSSKKVGDFSVVFGGGSSDGAGTPGLPSLPGDTVVLLQRYISRTGG